MLYGTINNGAAVVAPKSPSASPAGTATVLTPPPLPAAAPSVTVAGSTYTPDYKSLIENDPAYLAAQSAASASSGAAQAQRKKLLQQAFVQYGGAMPAGFTDPYGDIDQATKDAAAANQNSTIARLKTSYDQSRDQFMKQLAARGALQSGELGYGQDQLQRGLDQQEYDAGNQFLSGINGVYGDYTGTLNNNAQALAGAIGSAESSVYSNPAYRPNPGTTANYEASLSAQYGKPIYKADDGNLYDSNGNPFAPPSASPDPTQVGRFGNNGQNFGFF